MTLTNQERFTILAALRFYELHQQGDPNNRTDEIHDLATGDDTEISLDQPGIAELFNRIANDAAAAAEADLLTPLLQALLAAGLRDGQGESYDDLIREAIRLQAAAPSLLNLLEELAQYETSSHFTHSIHPDDMNRIRAALALLSGRA